MIEQKYLAYNAFWLLNGEEIINQEYLNEVEFEAIQQFKEEYIDELYNYILRLMNETHRDVRKKAIKVNVDILTYEYEDNEDLYNYELNIEGNSLTIDYKDFENLTREMIEKLFEV